MKTSNVILITLFHRFSFCHRVKLFSVNFLLFSLKYRVSTLHDRTKMSFLKNQIFLYSSSKNISKKLFRGNLFCFKLNKWECGKPFFIFFMLYLNNFCLIDVNIKPHSIHFSSRAFSKKSCSRHQLRSYLATHRFIQFYKPKLI